MKAHENYSLKRNVIYELSMLSMSQNKLLSVQLILTFYTGSTYLHTHTHTKVEQSSLYSLYVF